MLLVLNLPLIPLWIQVLKVPYSFLFSYILLFIFIGAYSLNNRATDLFIAVAFGIIGYFSRKFGYEGAPFILGLILGPLMEVALRRSLIMSDGSFLIFVQRPISASFIAMLGLAISFYLLLLKKRPKVGDESEE